MKKESMFYYGPQYFRPPNPPRKQHRFHLEQMKKELGFNVVKTFNVWKPATGRRKSSTSPNMKR